LGIKVRIEDEGANGNEAAYARALRSGRKTTLWKESYRIHPKAQREFWEWHFSNKEVTRVSLWDSCGQFGPKGLQLR
jgi:hypothetical protein